MKLVNDDIIIIQAPVELCRLTVAQRTLVKKYHTNKHIKAIGQWLILKHLSVPSWIQDWNKQKQVLFQVCKVNEQTFRSNLKLLQDMKLLSFDRYEISLCSWDELAKALEIDTKERFQIHYDVNDKKRVQEWLIATEIMDNQNRQSYSILKKLNKNPAEKLRIIHAMIAAGADRSQVMNPDYLLSWLRILYVNDFYRASEIHDLLIELRPDTNRSCKGIARAWNAKSPTTISYWKSVLASSGIIDIAKMAVLSTGRVRNPYCAVKWIKQAKQTMLPLCDQITVLTPWLCNDDLKKQIAA